MAIELQKRTLYEVRADLGFSAAFDDVVFHLTSTGSACILAMIVRLAARNMWDFRQGPSLRIGFPEKLGTHLHGGGLRGAGVLFVGVVCGGGQWAKQVVVDWQWQMTAKGSGALDWIEPETCSCSR